jgi:uncharacterized protein
MSPNLETVQSIYQAFGRGDIPSILSKLSPDVQWEPWSDNTAQRAGVPWLRPARGHDGVAGFFRVVSEFQIHEFKVLDVFGSGQQVVGEIVLDATVPATGVRMRDEELHLWSFDADGKVVRLRHYLDTAKHMRAAGVTSTA